MPLAWLGPPGNLGRLAFSGTASPVLRDQGRLEASALSLCPSPTAHVGFRGLGFRGLGFRVSGLRCLGVWGLGRRGLLVNKSFCLRAGALSNANSSLSGGSRSALHASSRQALDMKLQTRSLNQYRLSSTQALHLQLFIQLWVGSSGSTASFGDAWGSWRSISYL